MARDGSGTYNLPEAAFVYDTVISETAMNSNLSDIAAALTASIAKDGQTTPTNNMPWGGYKITGLGDGSASTDSTALHQIQDQDGIWCGTAGGTQNALTLSPTPAITAYAAGQKFRAIIGASSTNSTVTLAVSGLTTKAVQINGAACSATVYLETGKIYDFDYDGTAFQATRLSYDLQNIVSAASDSAAGIVELATTAETTTGTDTARAVTPAGLHGGLKGLTDTAIAAGDQIYFADASDSNNLKSDTVQGIIDLINSGGLVYIASATASGSASLDFPTQLTSTYDEYILKITGLQPATDQVSLNLRITDDSGSTYESASYQYANTWFGAAGADTLEGSSSAAQIIMSAPSSSAGSLGNAAAEGADYLVRFHKPSGTGFNKRVDFIGTYKNTEGTVIHSNGAGAFDGNTNAITGFQILMSSGNIATGTARLYGIVNS